MDNVKYTIIQQGDTVEPYVMEVMVDTEADVQNLPTEWKSGSSCLVLANSSVWMLGNDKKWHKI